MDLVQTISIVKHAETFPGWCEYLVELRAPLLSLPGSIVFGDGCTPSPLGKVVPGVGQSRRTTKFLHRDSASRAPG
jgi:hypothetical protein